MKGYKAFNTDLTCYNHFQYEIGKTYEPPSDEPPIICNQGFHFCPELIDCFRYYPVKLGVRIAEVEALGEIDPPLSDDKKYIKYCTDKIRIIREIPLKDLDFTFCSGTIKQNYNINFPTELYDRNMLFGAWDGHPIFDCITKQIKLDDDDTHLYTSDITYITNVKIKEKTS